MQMMCACKKKKNWEQQSGEFNYSEVVARNEYCFFLTLKSLTLKSLTLNALKSRWTILIEMPIPIIDAYTGGAEAERGFQYEPYFDIA